MAFAVVAEMIDKVARGIRNVYFGILSIFKSPAGSSEEAPGDDAASIRDCFKQPPAKSYYEPADPVIAKTEEERTQAEDGTGTQQHEEPNPEHEDSSGNNPG